MIRICEYLQMRTPSLQSVYDYVRYDCKLTIPLRLCAGSFGSPRSRLAAKLRVAGEAGAARG